jgi:hypothetical protein
LLWTSTRDGPGKGNLANYELEPEIALLPLFELFL